jgi:hypothetical protein
MDNICLFGEELIMEINVNDVREAQEVIDANEAKGVKEGQEPCYLCGRSTKLFHHVHIVNGGDTMTDELEDLRGDSLGFFPVGPKCFKKVQKAFGGQYPEYVFTDDMAYNSVVMAIGAKETARFQKTVRNLYSKVSDGAGHMDRAFFCEILGELVDSMKEDA